MVARSLILALALTWPTHVVAEEDAGKAGEVFGVLAESRYGPPIAGRATHYGESYNGRGMGCGGRYSSADPTIVAVSPSRYSEWPCGTQLRITGPAGAITVTRQDACPGCSANLVDLSEAGSSAVCGGRPQTCNVTIEQVLR